MQRFIFNTSRFFLSSSLDLFLANFVWYHRKIKRKVWGISKICRCGKRPYLLLPKTPHTGPTSLSERLQRKKKKTSTNGVPRRSKHLEFAFDLPPLSPFSISFLQFGIKLPVIFLFFSQFFLFFSLQSFLFFYCEGKHYEEFHVEMEFHKCCLIHAPLRLLTPDI